MVSRAMGADAPQSETAALAGAPMTWVDQVIALPDGFLGSMTAMDLDTGAVDRRLFRLNGDGAPRALAGLGAEGRPLLDGTASSHEVAYRSILAAATGSPALAGRLDAVLAATARMDVAWVVATGAELWLLTGDLRSDGPQADQRLVRIDLAVEGPPVLADQDLSGLNLGPHRPITLMARLGEGVVLAVADPVAGFDLFRLGAEGPQLLLGQGAMRFAVNAAVTAVGAGPEGLLIGTAALATSEQPLGAWGPELIEVRPDGTWRLIVGMPRFTPQGGVHPLSGRKPGFGQPGHAAITAIATGALNGRQVTCVAVQDHAGPAVEDRRLVEADLLAYAGAVQLYGSTDLASWFRIKLGDASLGCVTSLALAPQGLLVGHEGAEPGSVPAYLLQP